jgi:hypothetical protein
MSNFVDKALAVYKGETYFTKVNALQLIDKERYNNVVKLIDHFIALGEGYKTDVEELSMLAAISTYTFYCMNTLPVNVLIDIKFYSQNLYNVLAFLFGGAKELNPFTECSESLKGDNIYTDILAINTEVSHPELAMMKGRLFYHLIVTIIENNNSHEYQKPDVEV